MRTEYCREILSPSAVVAVQAAKTAFASRISRQLGKRVGTTIDDPHVKPHRLREVPRGTYFSIKNGSPATDKLIHIVQCNRSGDAIGKPINVPRERFDHVLTDRHIAPAFLFATPFVVVYHIEPDQWKTLSAILSADVPHKREAAPVITANLHGKRFRSFRDLSSAVACEVVGIPFRD